ncbi:response regulator [Marivita sp. GX14005]|uniref:response regulator n=1 Tax=Marivita sp. GX14005 TaxID=2942276 RepID=UPI0020190551|nr:response regulator [Marivita sp. GX14005]MCL3883657.1 sigma-54 dependent transcriptional regulator [Marivita sp. GX14005]
MDGTVLVADDDRTIRTVLTQALTRAGCKVHATSSLTTLMRWIAEGRGDVVISDVVMPDGNGLEMLPKIAQDRPDLPVIVVSAQNTIMTAIKAAEAKAFDYLPKPFDLPDLMARTGKALAARGTAPRAAPEPRAERESLPLIGQTPAMQALYRLVARLMHSDLPVLIRGESGTGKSLIARVLHDYSDRRSRPFVLAPTTDLDDPDRGARLLAAANGGTVVIDGVADLPDGAQAGLVHLMDRAPEHGIRFAATCRTGPEGAQAQAALRDDLYYRISGASLTVPPLRERVDDIAELAVHFLRKAAPETDPPRRLSPDCADLFRAYPWPGNVRQLENVLRRLGLTGSGGEITRAEAENALADQPQAGPVLGPAAGDRLSASVERHLRRYFDLHGDDLPPAGVYARILREIETPLIEICLDATGGNQAKCADLLGINRNTLRKKITDLDIQVTRRRKLM